ncbi:MAG: tetratricopeptide repeat protein [Thermodesulfobacteriota bacterium]
MPDVVSIHVWKEGEAYRSSVQEDVPATFAFPEPFWSEYIKKKEINPQYLAGFGEAIFRSAFNSVSREEMFQKTLAGLKQSPLTLSIASSEDIIHEIPWELMKPPGQGFLGSKGNIAFVRTLPGYEPALRKSSTPYRILVILSLPVETYDKAPLDPLRELDNLYRGLEGFIRRDMVKIDVCVRASLPEIRERLTKTRYDVLHFIGHGGRGGLLVLEHEEDFTRSHETTREEIQQLFGDLGVQAVILNACHTQSAALFSPSLALSIYRAGVPVVVANQSVVDDQEAIKTTRAVYENLLQADSFSSLLNMTRLRITAWWKPVLFTTPGLRGDGLFLPATLHPGSAERERVFQDLGTLGTAKTYVYRYRPLREITHHLAGDVRVIVLHGIGGAGKSFMADYLARFLRQDFAQVLAVDVRRLKDATAQGIREHILDTFETHEVIAKEESARLRATRAFPLFWRRLNQALGHGPWLLVLDNFEVFQDPWGVVKDEAVRDMLKTLAGPDWAGRLIITSRLIPYLDSRLSLEPVVEIGTYDDAEKRFLFGQLGEKEKKLIAENQAFVEDHLGWHPLATDLFLKSGSSRPETILGQQDLRQILQFYRTYLDTYGLAFARLFAMRHSMSRDLLALVLDDADLLDLVSRRLRLLQGQEDNLRPYPILRLAFEKDCPLSDRDLLGMAEVLLPFETKRPSDDLNRLVLLEQAEAVSGLAEEKVKKLQEEISSAANRLGVHLYERGALEPSAQLLKKALEIRKGLFGERHPDVAGSYNNLGLVYNAKGDLDEAILYHNQALEIRRGLFGERHPDVAISYNNLGSVYHDKGDLDEAIRHFNQALEILKGLFGERHPYVAGSYNNLGSVYHDKGDLDEAILYHNQALEIRRGLFGERHPDVATSYNNLGSVYHAKGDLDEAIRYCNLALEILKGLFGERHPDVATSYNNLGLVYNAKGDLGEAIRYHKQALEIRRGLFGERHPDVATSYNNLGGVYQDKRDLDEAIRHYRQALGIWKGLFGERHPDVATSYNNLGLVYIAKGDLGEAIRYHKQALEIRRGLFGERHPDVATSYNNLGSVYYAKGDLDEAIRYYDQALEILKGLYGERHPNVATSYGNLGKVYRDKGELEEAIRYLIQAREINKGLGYRKQEMRLCGVMSELCVKVGRTREGARLLCDAVNLLDFLKTDPDKAYWLSQASEILGLAEGLNQELEKEEFYTCREMITQYQDTLGPILESLRIMSSSSLEKVPLPEYPDI